MRTLHLIDIENLAEGWCHSRIGIAALGAYLDAAEWVEGDLVVVAANHRLAAAIGFEIAVPHRLIATGFQADAADMALLDHAAGDWVVRAVDRVSIGSGDHIFSPMVERFAGLGLRTSVVARPEALASRLAAVSDEVRLLASVRPAATACTTSPKDVRPSRPPIPSLVP